MRQVRATSAIRRLRGLAVDTSALHDSRDYRFLVLGGFVSSLGSQLTLVALPYQVFVLTGSSLQVGLIGLAELAPLVGLADAIVDVVSTGGTLKANNLVEVEEIMPISARLIVNQAALKMRQAAIAPLIAALERAAAQGDAAP